MALRTAVNRKGRPSRLTYEPGELVAFWRNVKRKKGKLLQPGWYRGTIIGPHRGTEEGNQSNYWVSSNGRLILVSKEQLRPTYGTERWRIEEEDLQNYLEDGHDFCEDETGDGPPEDDDDASARADLEMVVPPLMDEEYTPTTPIDTPREDPEVPAVQEGPEEMDVAINLKVPSTPSDGTQPHPDSPLAARASRAPGTPVAGLLQRKPPERVTPPRSLESEPFPKRPKTDEQPDGSQREAMVNNTYVPQYHYEKLAIPSSSVFMTRKDQKALEKEVPWSMIPDEQKPRLQRCPAMAKEWDTWLKYEAVVVLNNEASNYVSQNVDSSRILNTRVCYRNKNAAFPWMPIKYKARIVCRGDMDPDLLSLRRDAPTLARLSLMVILQIAISMADWFMFNADITGAFLQGDQSLASRKEPPLPSTASRRTSWTFPRPTFAGGSRNLWLGKFSTPILATSPRYSTSAWLCAVHFGQGLVFLLPGQQADPGSWRTRRRFDRHREAWRSGQGPQEASRHLRLRCLG